MTMICSKEEFLEMLAGIVASGVTFNASITKNNEIFIVFSGGY